MTARRREDRIVVSVPLRVWGLDANGKPFSQVATTLDVTRTGARIGGLNTTLQQGDIIGVQYENEKARYRVVWVGRHGTSQQGQAGIYCIEPGKYIWGAPLSRLKSKTEEPQLGPVIIKEPEIAPSQAAPAPQKSSQSDDRRESVRFSCSGSVQVINTQTGFPMGATISDISMHGCYIDTVHPMPAATKLTLVITLLGTEIRLEGEVRGSHPGVGMGVLFTNISVEDDERLRHVLNRLATLDNRPLIKPSSAPVKPAENRTVESASPTDSFESLLKAIGDVDPRVADEVRRAVDYARETSACVRKHLSTPNADTYELMEQVEAHRIRLVTELARELSLDIDSQIVQLGTEGITELMSAIGKLHSRLTTIAGNDNRS